MNSWLKSRRQSWPDQIGEMEGPVSDISDAEVDERRLRQQIRVKAMDLLARREYSRKELQQRLLQRDYAAELVDQVITQLLSECLLSDERFVESFINSRMQRGQGPVRIRAELRDRGISDDLIEAMLDMRDPVWRTSLYEIHARRFAGEMPTTPGERARQQRFFTYRGFTSEQIRALFRQDVDNEVE